MDREWYVQRLRRSIHDARFPGEIGVEQAKELIRSYVGADYKEKITRRLHEIGLVSPDEVVPFTHDPIRHRYGNVSSSEAWYLVDTYIGDDRILVSFLPPHARTSNHLHQSPIFEDYFPIEGVFLLNGQRLPGEGFTVVPEVAHQGTTQTDFALTAIAMRRARFVPDREQHIMVSSLRR